MGRSRNLEMEVMLLLETFMNNSFVQATEIDFLNFPLKFFFTISF